MDTDQDEAILGRPLEEQAASAEAYLSHGPLDELQSDPEARARVLVLLALERAQNEQYHHWYRWAADDGLRLLYAEIARMEARHVSSLASLLPHEDALGRTLWWEFTLIQTLGTIGQEETEADVRNALEYLLPDIVEHAFQVTQLGGAGVATQAEELLGRLALRRGRPIQNQAYATFDLLKRPAGCSISEALTVARLQLAVAVVRASQREYVNLLNAKFGAEARLLLGQIASVKEAHLILLESLLDSKRSALERAMASELGERAWYQHFLLGEADERLAAVFRRHLADENGHLVRLREEAIRRTGGPAQHLETAARVRGSLRPVPDYVEDLLKSQLQRRSKGQSYVEIGKTKEAFS